MKKILCLLVTVFMLQGIAFAENFEDKNVVNPSENIKSLFTDFSKNDEYYKAYAIDEKIDFSSGNTFSDSFRDDIDVYYTYSEDRKEVEILGVSKNNGNIVFSNSKTDISLGELPSYANLSEVFRMMTDESFDDEFTEQIAPMFMLSEDNKILRAFVWVKYNDGSENVRGYIEYINDAAEYENISFEEMFGKKVPVIPQMTEFKKFNDCDDSQLELLQRMGIFEGSDGNFNPDSVLTRAEAAKLIATFMFGSDRTYEQTDNLFSDVENHWAKNIINTLAGMNVINGFPDGTFGADLHVTKIQFAKLLLNAIGNEDKASAFGGYPSGYAKLASDEGITEQADDTELTRMEAAKMIYNALSCKIYVISGMDFSGGNSVAYTFEKSNDDVLKRVFACRRVKGKLTSNNDLASGEIGGETVYFKYSDAKEYCDKEYVHYIIDRDGINVWIAARE